MNKTSILIGMCFGSVAILLGVMSAEAIPGDERRGTIGADVAVCDLPNIYRWGTYGGRTGYSVGTTSVNLGDENLEWVEATNRHPRIPQNAYRFMDGRFTQIGMSWCKDGFCAINLTGCEESGRTCVDPGGCPPYLVPNCADPYGDSLNGSWGRLSPRSQCNAATGWFLYPPFQIENAVHAPDRRMAILVDDLAPAQNPDATYYCEGIYLHPQDAEAGNDNNNASFRRMTVGSLSISGYLLSPAGSTYKYQPAIHAWELHSKSVEFKAHDIADDGRLITGIDVIDNGDGTWRYEYAIYNQNSHECVKAFNVPIPAGVNVSDIGFHDIHHHSGEPFSTEDWVISRNSNGITWQTDAFNLKPNANAIRWGTMYNFWFTANRPPAADSGSFTLFRSGDPVTFELIASAGPNNIFDLNGDGCVDGGDLGMFLTYWGTSNPAGDFNNDGIVDGGDAGVLLANWGPEDCR